MESGIISDGQISVSSEWHTGKFGVNMSRLNSPRSWKSGTKDNYQWLQIDLGNPLTTITRVATQGRENSQNPQWVTKYQLQYSVNGINFLYYKEHGQNLPKVGEPALTTRQFLYIFSRLNLRNWSHCDHFKNECKIVMVERVSIKFLPTVSPLNQILGSWEWRKWSRTREAHDC